MTALEGIHGGRGPFSGARKPLTGGLEGWPEDLHVEDRQSLRSLAASAQCPWASFLALCMRVLPLESRARLWGSPGSFLPPAGPPALPSSELHFLLEFQWRLTAQGNSLGM